MVFHLADIFKENLHPGRSDIGEVLSVTNLANLVCDFVLALGSEQAPQKLDERVREEYLALSLAVLIEHLKVTSPDFLCIAAKQGFYGLYQLFFPSDPVRSNQHQHNLRCFGLFRQVLRHIEGLAKHDTLPVKWMTLNFCVDFIV